MNVDPPSFAQWALSITIAALGGVAAFLRKLQADELRRVWYLELVIDLFIGAFAGMLTGLIGQSIGLPPMILMATTGIAGVMGYKALNKLTSFFDKFLGVPPAGGGQA